MTANQIYKKMVSTAQSLSAQELKDQAVKLMNDSTEGAGIMFNVVLTALESKMPESEYVEFCNAM